MKSILIPMTLITLIFSVAAFGQSEDKSEPQNDSESRILETQAKEYFKAVVDKDYETIFKYVHPYIVEEIGDKKTVIGLLKLGIDELRKEGITIASFSDVRIELANNKEAAIPAIVYHRTMMRMREVGVELNGQMKVYEFKGKNYFIIREEMILGSFGIPEFDDDEEDEPEKKGDPR